MHMGSTSRGRALARIGAVLCVTALAAPGLAAEAAASGPGGQPGYLSAVTEQLDARTSASLDPTTGNLVISQRDLTAAPDTYNVTYERWYNSQNAGQAGLLGTGWSVSVGPQVRVEDLGSGRVRLRGRTGYALELRDTDGDGIYEGRLTAGLLRRTATGWEYADEATDEDLIFSFAGTLTAVQTLAGRYTVQNTSAGGQTVWSSYGTQDGRRVNVSYDGSGRVRQTDDPASMHRYYRYDAGRLTAYDGPEGTTRYDYDAGGRLRLLTRPDGGTIEAVYASDGRVLSLVVRPTDRPAVSYALSYAGGVSTLTSPDGSQTSYEGDSLGLAVATRTPPSAAGVTLAGSLYAARDTLLAPGAHSLTIDSAATGVQRVEVLVDDDVTASFATLPATFELDTADLAAGSYVVRVRVTTSGGQVSTSAFAVEAPNTPDETGDGTLPGELMPGPEDETPLGAEACEAEEGVGSPYCTETDDGGDAAGASALRFGFAAQAASTRDLIYGISDDDAPVVRQGVTTYLKSPLFTALKVRRVRRVVAWNVIRFPNRARQFANFYRAAVDAGKDIMVSFQLGCDADSATDPQPACYPSGSGRAAPPAIVTWERAIRDFRKRFPLVRSISAWNEPNDRRQPTNSAYGGAGAKRAALYTYRLERNVCRPARAAGRTCRVIAGDLAQSPNRTELRYLNTYRAQLDSYYSAGPSGLRRPEVWAVHPYTDIARERSVLDTTNTHAFLRAIPAGIDVWFTEGGSRLDLGITQAEQAREVAYYVDELSKISTRVKRLYLYQLCAGDSSFDSGLLEPGPGALQANGQRYCSDDPRPAYAVYKTRTLRNPNG
jgi:YD repeat-containing protein